jgi:hypothetical protein
LDSNAISVGYAIQSSVVLQKCGNYWCRLGTSQVVNSSLVNSISSNIVSLIENYQYTTCSSTFETITQEKGLTKILSDCNKALNGLWYDNCEGGNRSWSNAYSYCSSKGMRLAAIDETRYSSGSGVHSCGSWTWTSSSYPGNSSSYWLWDGGSANGNGYLNTYYVRCVR